MRIVIVGAGAIGKFFGGMLNRGNNEVIFIENNPEIVKAVNEEGIKFLELKDGRSKIYYSAKEVHATTNSRSIETCDLTIIAVKSYATAVAARSITHLANSQNPVISIQSGFGNVETLSSIVKKNNVLASVTFHGATSLNSSNVRHSGEGRTLVGEIDGQISERVERVKDIFVESGIKTEVSSNIIGHIWAKSLVYSAINPLTAILRIKNGQLIKKMESIALAKRLIDEGKILAQAYAVQLPEEDLYDSMLEACHKTAENLSPMLQDILNTRPTEIEALNGALYTMGKHKGIAVPTHQCITDLIRLLEKWEFVMF
jgi:2-dehydropantoate 2-reductase